MIVSIAQPAYLPWLGYFDRIAQSDLAIVLDDVQFERRGFTHRNKILGANGPAWLTLPVNKKGKYHGLISELTIDNTQNWRGKHQGSIVHSYGKAPYFQEISARLFEIFDREWNELADVLRFSTDLLMSLLALECPRVYSSEMNVSGTKSDLILNLCKKADATKYLSGPFGRDYLDLESFDEAGIEIIYHDYDHPTYEQLHSGFEPNMSVIDLLFNHGPGALDILTIGNARSGAQTTSGSV